MKFEDLSELGKINAEQQIYQQLLTTDVYKQMVEALIHMGTEKYIYDKNGNIELAVHKKRKTIERVW